MTAWCFYLPPRPQTPFALSLSKGFPSFFGVGEEGEPLPFGRLRPDRLRANGFFWGEEIFWETRSREAVYAVDLWSRRQGPQPSDQRKDGNRGSSFERNTDPEGLRGA